MPTEGGDRKSDLLSSIHHNACKSIELRGQVLTIQRLLSWMELNYCPQSLILRDLIQNPNTPELDSVMIPMEQFP